MDTAYNDRQELINESEPLVGGGSDTLARGEHLHASSTVGSIPTALDPDTWEAIEEQLSFWAAMDAEYWRQRKEKEYGAWFERTYGIWPDAVKEVTQ